MSGLFVNLKTALGALVLCFTAICRIYSKAMAITLLHKLQGWMFIGCIGSLILALSYKVKKERTNQSSTS
jgi:lipid-A-disaccharide synthase-like uncharacterized protein